MRAFKKIYNIISTVVIILIVLLAILLAGVRLFGITPYTVISGSMEPTYPVGCIVYVVDVDPNSLKVGDPVTYYVGNVVCTHRVVKVIDKGYGRVEYVTKGDANNDPDAGEPLLPSDVIGKPIFMVPLIGYLAVFIQTPPGVFIALGFCLALLLLGFLPDIISSGKAIAAENEDRAAEEQKKADELADMRAAVEQMKRNLEYMQNMQNTQNMQPPSPPPPPPPPPQQYYTDNSVYTPPQYTDVPYMNNANPGGQTPAVPGADIPGPDASSGADNS